MAKLLALAVALGIVASLAASVFMAVVEEGQMLLFESLPTSLGFDSAPWWLIGLVLLVGAGLIAIARRMPGATGAGPLGGFHFDTPVAALPSVLLAAFGTLAFGFVLGPEAPLIVIGSVIGALALRRRGEREQMAGRLLGGSAAIGAVFGNPFITAFMLLEFAANGLMPASVLVPVLLALASGYAVQVGFLGLDGLGVHSLSVSGLPNYDTIGFGHLVVALVVAAVAGALVTIVRMGAVRLDIAAMRRPVPALLVVALITLLVVVGAQAVGASPELVLFSGSAAMDELTQQGSLAIVIAVVAAKAIAFAAALGGGFRGGPVFPAAYLGVAVAITASLLLTDVPVTPLAAAGIAASAAAMIKLPATSALLGALIIAGSGPAVAPFAIVGAIVGLGIRLAADRRQVAAPTPG